MCDGSFCIGPGRDAGNLAIETIMALKGIGKGIAVLSCCDKKIIGNAREKKNILNRGVADALSRDVTIAFSHNENFRPPACAIVLLSRDGKIVGEMANSGKMFYGGKQEFDMYVLPPVPFPELEKEFRDVCSASPGFEADKFLRTLIRVEDNDATLLVGFNIG